MKRFYVLAVALALSASAFLANAESYKSLNIALTDGTQVGVDLSEDMKMTFTATDFHITSESTDLDVPREKIKSFEFATSTVGIDQIEAVPVTVDGALSFKALPEGTRVAVYATNGVLLAAYEVAGDWQLDLSTLPKGVSIVSVNGMSYKFNIR